MLVLMLAGLGVTVALTYEPYIVGVAIPLYYGVLLLTLLPTLRYFQVSAQCGGARDERVVCNHTLQAGDDLFSNQQSFSPTESILVDDLLKLIF